MGALKKMSMLSQRSSKQCCWAQQFLHKKKGSSACFVACVKTGGVEKKTLSFQMYSCDEGKIASTSACVFLVLSIPAGQVQELFQTRCSVGTLCSGTHVSLFWHSCVWISCSLPNMFHK